MGKRFIQLFEDSIKEYWNLESMTNFESNLMYKYKDVAREIAKLHILYDELGVGQDDRILIMGSNKPETAITFISTITYGAVAVPILSNSSSDDVNYVLEDCTPKLFFVDDTIWGKLDVNIGNKKGLKGVISLSNFQCLSQSEDKAVFAAIKNLVSLYSSKYPNGVDLKDIVYSDKGDDKLTMLNYTSGSTGHGKAVMMKGDLFHELFAIEQKHHLVGGKGENIISYLPLAHVFGCNTEVLAPFINGSHITFFPSLMSVDNMLKAFQQIRPSFVMLVPLVMEAVYKTYVIPALKEMVDGDMTKLTENQSEELKRIICDLFGGNFHLLMILGAACNEDIEKLLYKIKFPYFTGYGMTEHPCVALNVYEIVPTSVGKIVENVNLIIDSEDPENIPGEILLKSKQLMMGYYNNEEATSLVFTKDGWFRTGDLGILDRNGILYLKGRCKNMILTSSGQNVSPESIEMKLNESPYICESVVVQDGNKIVARVYPDYDFIDKKISSSELQDLMERVRKDINMRLASYESIAKFIVHSSPFEKTIKGNIKRHLYEINK